MIALVYPQCSRIGGIARYIRSFVINYPSDAEQLEVITDTDELPDGAPANVRYRHVPVPAGRLGLLIWSLRVRAILIRLHRRGSLSVINLHIPPLFCGVFLPATAPIVVTSHTTYVGMSGTFYKPAQFRSDWNYWSVAIKTRIEKYLFRKAKSIITLTEQGKQELLTYGINKPIAIIPNGVDVAEFDPDASADKTIDVIFTGRIEKRKGSDTLADVIRELIRIKPSIKICIVGDGPEAPKVKDELSALYENVQMTGKVPFHEVAALLQRSRIYASTSYYEGLPGTCLEAMAMGLPAITWDFGFYDDLVVNGETGFRIKPNDVSTFAFRACSLLDSPSLSRMSREARSVVLSGYDWQDLSRRVVDALTASAGIQPSRLTQSS